ncbi:hypothetical protein ENBRE01_1657 [Enteropsectra breve]|nr:hypothetical protein ENBRE01_1657 [Enteropsectra breve]
MHIFHILITAVNCLSYTIMPWEMLLVDKRELSESAGCRPNCTICNKNINSSTSAENYDASEASFENFSYNHFRCSCCSSIFHARCFVHKTFDKFTICPNPYCFTMYSESEMERFFGQLLLSYAYNNRPIKEFKNLYDEYKKIKFNVIDINTHELNSELVSFASLPDIKKALSAQSKIKKVKDESIFFDILINGRMALALMDPCIWKKLYEYLRRKEVIGCKIKTYMMEMVNGKKRNASKEFDALDNPILSPRDKLYNIFILARAMRGKNDNYYMDVYFDNVENAKCPEICAKYFFSYLFQRPHALLTIEYSKLCYKSSIQNSDGSLKEPFSTVLDNFDSYYQDALLSISEAAFRKLYNDYIYSTQNQGSLAIHLSTHTDYKKNYLVKMLVRLVLGTGGQPALYSAYHRNLLFEVLFFCCKSRAIFLYPGEICGLLKCLNANIVYFTPEERDNSINILKWMLEMPLPPEAIELYVDTLINNYSTFLGWIYAQYIPHVTLLEMVNGNLRDKFKDPASANDFRMRLLFYQSIRLYRD